MKEIIYINGKQYKEVSDKCPLCGAEGLHGCTGGQTNRGGIFENINKVEEKCLWDSMPETYPGSGIKIAGLSCRCKKCIIYF